MTPEPKRPSHDTLDATSAAELRVELILLVALVLVTIGLYVVLLVIGNGERVLARGVVVVMAGFAFSGTVLALRMLDVMPRLQRRSH